MCTVKGLFVLKFNSDGGDSSSDDDDDDSNGGSSSHECSDGCCISGEYIMMILTVVVTTAQMNLMGLVVHMATIMAKLVMTLILVVNVFNVIMTAKLCKWTIWV